VAGFAAGFRTWGEKPEPMNVTPVMWDALSSLLDEALDLDANARAVWIAGIATRQPELAPLLHRLLAAHGTAETADILARLPASSAASAPVVAVTGLTAGRLVGAYRLKREIGSGGMADLWLAERADGAFERDVALKIPRLTRLRRDLAVRFAHERDILARLEHPYIARFYDAGLTDDGLPFLAMEYVAGRPITQWCDERGLGLPARLGLLDQVLDAVQFAHANLIIHRDLKPSNILVTDTGQVRLLDFGIAKLLAEGNSAQETQLTQFSGRALTPQYASPEQIRGAALTTATDVYSLAVVLYELLTGCLPYQLPVRSAAQLEEAILSADPVRPSHALTASAAQARGATVPRLRRVLRGDIDAIVLKALAKEPGRRYATVAEFSQDLTRYLAGKPVQAQPASWTYDAGKFVRRNRLAVSIAAVAAVALMAVAAVALWQAQVARRQSARAEEVRALVLSFVESADVDRGGSRQTTAAELLARAHRLLDTSAITDDAIHVQLLIAIGGGLQGLGELKEATPMLAEAVRLARRRFGEDVNLARAQVAYGFALQTSAPQQALEQFASAERISRRTGDDAVLADALRGRSTLLVDQGKYAAAREMAQASVRSADRAAPPDVRSQIAAYAQLGAAMISDGTRGAYMPARHAYELARRFYHDRPMAQLLDAQSTYVTALGQAEDTEKALQDLEAVLEQQKHLLGPESLAVAHTYADLGSMSLRLGDTGAAVTDFREVLRIRAAQSGGKLTNDLAIAHLNFGSVLANDHHYEEALAQWRDAVEEFTRLDGPDSEPARVARSGTGFALTRLGEFAAADQIFAPLIRGPFNNPVEAAFIKGRLGQLRSAQGRHAEALALLRDLPDVFADRANSRLRALALGEYGAAQLDAGRPADALRSLSDAHKLLSKSLIHGSPDLSDIDIDIARAQLALGDAQAATAAAQEAAGYWLRVGPARRETGVALLWQVKALAASGHLDDARRGLQQATTILAASGTPKDREFLEQVRRIVPGHAAVRG